MANSRNIDIKKVPKVRATKQSNPGLDIKMRTKPAPMVKPKAESKNVSPKPKQRTKDHRVGYFAVQASAWRAVATADIFQFSFVRNLFSLRVLFFAVLPIFIYQLRYILVLKPDELLNNLKSGLGAESTSGIIAFGMALLTLAIVSWLADTLITPAILRYRYQQLDKRRVSIGRTLRESSSVVLHNVWQKTVKTAVFIIMVLALFIGLYVSYVLGYGSISQQVVFGSIVGFVVLLLFCMYFALRFWMQTITAVGGTGERSGISLAFRQLFRHPLTSFGYGLSWVVSLIITIALSILIVMMTVYGLDNTNVVSLHIIYLAGSTTLICVLWSVWTAWQNGYWSKLVHSRSRELRLVVSHEDQLQYWHFLILIIFVLFVITIYIVLAYLFADQLNSALRSISSKLPHSFELNLPKPQ